MQTVKSMEKRKYFFITIDSEGDNLWSRKQREDIRTENVRFLPRFQNLCDRYDFKPVWLSNYEMINDARYVDFIAKNLEEGKCELGMHLHAWNTPPFYRLPSAKDSGAAYLIEYPPEIMEAKISVMTETIRKRFGLQPVSHRAGRWAMNDDYFRLLYQYGYRIDCSFTPGISWKKNPGCTPGTVGSNYLHEKAEISNRWGVMEIPVSIVGTRKPFLSGEKSLLGNILEITHVLRGSRLWLRPNGTNLEEMKWLLRKSEKTDKEYLMFMLHSSELMPGGSPAFKSENAIESLYRDMDILFQEIAKSYKGLTLEAYLNEKEGSKSLL